jgi:hypothetical protein
MWLPSSFGDVRFFQYFEPFEPCHLRSGFRRGQDFQIDHRMVFYLQSLSINSLRGLDFTHNHWRDIRAITQVQWDNCVHKWHQPFWILSCHLRIERYEANSIDSKSQNLIMKILLNHVEIANMKSLLSPSYGARKIWPNVLGAGLDVF